MATISHKLKIIFIEVPRTGSTSFRNSLIEFDPACEKVGKRHDTALEVKNKIDSKIWDTYTKIGFVRDPESWTNSVLTFPMIAMVIVQGRTPYDWFVDESGNVIIDNVYRTEDMDDIMQTNGLPLKRMNVRSPDFVRPGGPLPKETIFTSNPSFEREIEHYKPGATPAVKFKKND